MTRWPDGRREEGSVTPQSTLGRGVLTALVDNEDKYSEDFFAFVSLNVESSRIIVRSREVSLETEQSHNIKQLKYLCSDRLACDQVQNVDYVDF